MPFMVLVGTTKEFIPLIVITNIFICFFFQILDLDVTFPRAIANAIIKSGKNCEFDSDCHLFDCHSVCNKEKKICDGPVTNSNLQVIIKKYIFLIMNYYYLFINFSCKLSIIITTRTKFCYR